MDWLNTFGEGGAAIQPEWLPLAAFWLLLFLLAAAESFWPLHREQKDAAARLPANFGLGIVNAALWSLLPVTAVTAAEWSRLEGLGLLHIWGAPFALAAAATVLVRSFLAYFLHRLAHVSPVLWRVHKVHHCDTAIDLSTGLRHHPIELLYLSVIGAGIAAALGLSPVVLAAYDLFALGFSLWTHANVRIPERLDRTVASLLVTPAVHHVHHSSRQVETDSNYGDVFTLWDRIFGTFRAPPHEEVRGIRFGLGEEQDEGAANLLVQLRSPFTQARIRSSQEA